MTNEKLPERTKGECPQCGGSRNADIVSKHVNREQDQDGTNYIQGYYILRCLGCENIYFQMTNSSDDDYVQVDNDEYEYRVYRTYYPTVKRVRPDWINGLIAIDTKIYSLTMEMYAAIDADLRVLSAIGMRTVIDRATEHLGIDPGHNFAEKLKQLLDQGRIGSSENEILTVLVDAGSAAAHRGWKPSEHDLKTMATIVEAFIHRTFIIGDEARKLKTKVPPKPPRPRR